MTRFEIEKRLQLISGYSKTILERGLLNDELLLNKMISFLTAPIDEMYDKLLTIIPRGEKYQYATEPANFMHNMLILSKCISVVNEEEDPMEYKTLERYRYCAAERLIKEVNKTMEYNGNTPLKLTKCE